MSIKNAPDRWKEISAAAKELGAGDWAMRAWLKRCEIPASWKLKLIKHTDGDLSLDDMVISDHRKKKSDVAA